MTDTPIDRERVARLLKSADGLYHHLHYSNIADDVDRATVGNMCQALRSLLAAKEAAEAKIDACKVYLKDHQNPADRLAQNHREICSLLEMLAKDRKRAEAAEAKLAVAVASLTRIADLTQHNMGMTPREETVVYMDTEKALAQIQKEGTDNDG